MRSFGFLAASSDYAAAQPQVTLLETELQQRTQRSLPALGAAPPFTVDRSARQDERGRTIASAPAGAVVLVHGEPDVGKSALALATVDSVRASGGAALVMSLRDLPRKAVDLKAALGLGPVDLLATAPSAPVSVLLLDGAEILQECESGALTALLDAAASAGRTVVLVSRDDAAGSIRELLRERGAVIPLSSLSIRCPTMKLVQSSRRSQNLPGSCPIHGHPGCCACGFQKSAWPASCCDAGWRSPPSPDDSGACAARRRARPRR